MISLACTIKPNKKVRWYEVMTIKEVIKKFNLDYTAAWWLPKVVEPDKKVQLENCYFTTMMKTDRTRIAKTRYINGKVTRMGFEFKNINQEKQLN